MDKMTEIEILFVAEMSVEQGNDLMPLIEAQGWNIDTLHSQDKEFYYIAYYYQDGIDVVRYSIEENGIKIPNKEEYLCSAVTIQSLSYSDLFLSPRCWFSPLNDLTVILKKDLS